MFNIFDSLKNDLNASEAIGTVYDLAQNIL